MLTSSAAYWFQFFLDSGIPADDAGKYAGSFSKNRISASMAIDLNKEYLEQLGITALGDCIAILKHAKELYAMELREKQLKKPSSNKLNNPNDIYFNKPKTAEALLEATSNSTKKQESSESVSIEADSVSDSTFKNADNLHKSVDPSNLKGISKETFKSCAESTKTDSNSSRSEKDQSKSKNLYDEVIKESNDFCSVRKDGVSKEIGRGKDDGSKDLKKYEDEEMESSGDDEMCYVEHKTVSIAPRNNEREKHNKKTATKRSLQLIENNKNQQNSDKKSVFERLGHETIEERRIVNNQLDFASVFNRLGHKVLKKRKVSVIINKSVYETSESSDDGDNDGTNDLNGKNVIPYDEEKISAKSANFKNPQKTISAGVLSANAIQPDKFIKSSEGIFSPHASPHQLSIAKRLGRRIPDKIVMDKAEDSTELAARVKAESKRVARFVKAELIKSNYQEKTLENQAKKLKTERLIKCNIIGPDRLSKGSGTMQMDKMRVQVFERLGGK